MAAAQIHDRQLRQKVVPLWDEWASGGTGAVKNLTKDFGEEFLNSRSTARTTVFLVKAIEARLRATPPAVPAGGSVTLDVRTLVPAAVKAIDDPASPDQMDFNFPGEVAGNIAGGIGKDQKATPIGKNPSPQDDERIAKGDVMVFDVGANLWVLPRLSYTVNDTVDLCPGNCGTRREQIATVQMSRWEATGISGDVPFTVDFPAPPLSALPFTIPKPGAPVSLPPPPVSPPKSP